MNLNTQIIYCRLSSFTLTFNDLDLPNEKLIFLKAKIKDCASSSLKSYNGKGTVSNLNKDEIPF